VERTGYELPENTVIVLDEAGMCDARTFVCLVRAAEQARTKVIPLGTTGKSPPWPWLSAASARSDALAATSHRGRQRQVSDLPYPARV
jgi:hypothetical protein